MLKSKLLKSELTFLNYIISNHLKDLVKDIKILSIYNKINN